MGEAFLINQLLNGDGQAVETFVNENRKRVFRICMAYLHNEADATDLTQEVFIKAFEKMSQFSGSAKLSTWLTRIAINHSLNFLRNNRKRLMQTELSDIENFSAPANELQDETVKKAVRKAIYNLPQKQREVFILSFYLDMSYAEISENTALSVSSVESLLFRARKNLRDLLQDFYNNLTNKTQDF